MEKTEMRDPKTTVCKSIHNENVERYDLCTFQRNARSVVWVSFCSGPDAKQPTSKEMWYGTLEGQRGCYFGPKLFRVNRSTREGGVVPMNRSCN